ncbi:MAG: SUMF1/EgtB/PvdO family nonheme iron enzyme [Planctomycetota bacterium]
MPPRPDDLKQDRLVASFPRDNKGRPVIGDVSLLRRIGVGGMGSVYLGRQGALRREVAVKILPFTLVEADPGLARRFASEARLAAKLESDHVVRVYGAGIQHRTHFFVMQYVPGESAGQYLKRSLEEEEFIPEDVALEITIAATKGLAAAHDKGIIHRDVKPDNILIPEGDFEGAKLADLGLAKPEGSMQTFGTLSNVAMGTPGFMAPEQAENAKSAGPAADVFAMGATFYALLMGGPPFRGSSLVAVIRAAMEEDHPPLPDTVSGGIRWVIDRCLCKNPKDRFRDGSELLAALLRVQKNPNATMAKQRSVVEHIPEKKRSKAPLWAGATLLAAGLLVAGFWYLRHRRGNEAPPEPPRDMAAEKLDELFAQAAKQETAGRHEDALSTLTRVAAYAPDDRRLREMRERIGEKIVAAKAASEKSASYRSYLPAADATRLAADAADTVELWDKMLEACAKLEPSAQTDTEKQMVGQMKSEATQRRHWAAARVAEKGGDLAGALELARKAAASGGPKNDFLDAYIAAIELKAKETEGKLRKKKEFDAAVAAAEREPDVMKARALWTTAVGLAEDPADLSRAQLKLREVTDRLQGAERDTLFDAAMREGNEALSSGNLDAAAKRFQDALDLKPDEPKALEMQRAVADRRVAKEWEAVLKEIEAAKKGGDPAVLKLAYRKALALKDDRDIARALTELESEDTAIKPKVSGDRIEAVLDAGSGVKMEFVKVKPGTFTLGASSDARKVILTREFFIQSTEVTQDQWAAIMGTNPSYFRGGNLPVEQISWYDAIEFIERLNLRLAGWSAALPSVAQWECACRAGSKWDWGAAESQEALAEFAWLPKNSGEKTHPVGALKPNAWGLFDMQGNIWEFCWDWMAPVPSTPELTDPVGPASGTLKHIRGGCYNDGNAATPATRSEADPRKRVGSVGFRMILVPGKEGNPHLKRMSVMLDESKKLRMDFVHIRSGKFVAGAPGSVNPDAAAHSVTITEDYWISTTETTQAQWESIVGRKTFSRRAADLPADTLSWNDLQDFTRRLASKTGKLKPALPTEAEWEYACRGGASSVYQSGDTLDRIGEFAWHAANAKEAQTVGKLRPNSWGLYDMAGNVREWCSDWYAPYSGDATDPHGPDKGTERVIRGGAWDEPASATASGARARLAPDKRIPNVGFRVVLR